jgi:hypothetical protein
VSETWYYLSFVREHFLGACVVEAEDAAHAVTVATQRGCNPGGEIMIFAAPRNKRFPFPPYILLQKPELHAIDGTSATLGEIEDEGVLDTSQTLDGVPIIMVHEGCNPVKTRLPD